MPLSQTYPARLAGGGPGKLVRPWIRTFDATAVWQSWAPMCTAWSLFLLILNIISDPNVIYNLKCQKRTYI
jgi:hypothetical protein